MHYLLCLSLLFSLLGQCAEKEETVCAPHKIVYFTLPKGGSQLFRRAISLLSERPLRKLPLLQDYETSYPDFLRSEDPLIAYHHLDPAFHAILQDQTTKLIKIIMIRDLRDALVSMRTWIHAMQDTEAAYAFTQLPLDEQLEELILSPNLAMNLHYPIVFDLSLASHVAVQWMQDPTVLVCRFEDLVGPLGGGSRLRQIQCLQALAQHIHCFPPQERLEQIADSLFGESATFYKGQIGSWKEAFTSRHKELFKAVMGQELIALGYEFNDQW